MDHPSSRSNTSIARDRSIFQRSERLDVSSFTDIMNVSSPLGLRMQTVMQLHKLSPSHFPQSCSTVFRHSRLSLSCITCAKTGYFSVGSTRSEEGTADEGIGSTFCLLCALSFFFDFPPIVMFDARSRKIGISTLSCSRCRLSSKYTDHALVSCSTFFQTEEHQVFIQ